MAILSRTLDDFQSKAVITLNKATEIYPLWLSFPNAEEPEGPGAIPYGDTILFASAKVLDADGVDHAEELLVGAPLVVDANKVQVGLGHFGPGVVYEPGWYTLVIILSLIPSGSKIGYNARRIWIE